MFTPKFNLERELCNISILSPHTWIKTETFIICRQVKEEIKGMDICYIALQKCLMGLNRDRFSIELWQSSSHCELEKTLKCNKTNEKSK